MAESISNSRLSDIKRDAIIAARGCSMRGLMQSSKWLAELSYSLDVAISPIESSHLAEHHPEFDRVTLAKTYFDLKEYDRAAHFVEKCQSPIGYFIHMYARYLAGEKKKLDDAPDSIGPQDKLLNEHLKILRTDLQTKYKDNSLDGYCLYLYGIVLKKLDLVKECTNVFVEAVKKEPLLWAAWLELSLLATDKEMLTTLGLPNNWMYQFFLAHASVELQLNEEALKLYQNLSDSGFSKSTYVMAQIAMAHHNIRDVDLAVESFGKLQNIDPYRLENMDTYSNLLYVKEMRAELAHLAHHCCSIDKYRVETCCVIGNYYSLRSQHEKAVLYFQRALKLNPNYLSAWTLMGHEFMELKNTSAAIQAYRQAIEVNKRDYRAWYGLGQTYEILKLPFYCLYYYRQAQALRPNDARMVVALGEAYEHLGRLQEAKKCFWKAHSLGDVEGLSLMKLAKLYERLGEKDQAAAAYTDYIHQTEEKGICNVEDISNAYKFLANYHLKLGNLDEAYFAAQKCTDYSESREEGKALLRLISGLRAKSGDGGLQIYDAPLSEDRNSQLHPQQQTTPLQRLSPMNLNLTYTP